MSLLSSTTTSDGFAAVARRPAYSVLANHRLGELAWTISKTGGKRWRNT